MYNSIINKIFKINKDDLIFMTKTTMKQRIKDKYDKLSNKEKIVAKYIIDNYQQSMLLSSTELAKISGVSDTAVVRFAKSLGFKVFLNIHPFKKKRCLL